MKTEDRHSVWFCSSCNGMADNASLFVEYFLLDYILCLGRCSSRGAVNRFIFVSILEQQYFWWRFYLAFSNTLGLYSACLPFRFF